MNSSLKWNNLLVIFGLPLLLIFSMILLAKSPFLDEYPARLSAAITIDLLLTIPLVYFFLIRKKKIPKTTVVPFFVLGLIAASFVIPTEHQSVLAQFKTWVLPLVELTVLTIIILKVRQTRKLYKQQKGETADFYTALKSATDEILPKGASAAFATEISVFYYGFFNWKKRKINLNEFSYHKNSGSVALLAVFLLLIFVETAALHLLLSKWSIIAAWVLTILSLYSALQVLGILRSLSKRPISIEENVLKLRYGLFSESTIPIAEIESVESTTRELEFGKETRSLSPLRDYNMLMKVKEKQVLTGLYGFKKEYQTIAFFVDEKEVFLQKINTKLS